MSRSRGLAAALLALALVSCGGTEQATPAQPAAVTVTVTVPATAAPPTMSSPASTPSPTSAPSSSDPTAEEAEPEPEDTAEASPTPTVINGIAQGGAVAQVGAKYGYRYSSGLVVRITKLALQRPSVGASVTPTSEQTGLIVTIKYENESDETITPNVLPAVSAGADGVQAESYTDSNNGTGLGFESSIRPGRSGTASYAFLIDKASASQLQIQTTPSNTDYAAVTFEGSAPSS